MSGARMRGWTTRALRGVALAIALAAVVSVGTQTTGCGDDEGDLPCCPACGDGVCGGDEISCNCAGECPLQVCLALLPTCGDGRCDRNFSPGESHESCPADCPAPFACRVCRR